MHEIPVAVDAQAKAPAMATCFSTDVSATVVRSFHYSSTRAGGVEVCWHQSFLFPFSSTKAFVDNLHSGIPEVPNSPTTNSRRQTSPSRQGRWAARTIIAECERLCDGIMRQVFFGYGRKSAQVPAMDVSFKTTTGGNNGGNNNGISNNHPYSKNGQLQRPPQLHQMGARPTARPKGPVRMIRRSSELQTRVAAYLEVFDYVGGSAFRGFVSEKGPLSKPERSLFLFFDKGVNGTELKSGLVALIDLATECFDCQDLVICLDRDTDGLSKLSAL